MVWGVGVIVFVEAVFGGEVVGGKVEEGGGLEKDGFAGLAEAVVRDVGESGGHFECWCLRYVTAVEILLWVGFGCSYGGCLGRRVLMVMVSRL